jgi:SAM-dependent methyltransferase
MAVTREDVVNGYRFVLGREPESEKAITSHLESKDVQDFRNKLLASREFLSKLSGTTNANAAYRPIPVNLPANDIEVDISQELLAACLEKVKAAWTHLGLVSPHYSVLTNKQYLPENFEAKADGFWDTAKRDWSDIDAIAARHNFKISSELQATEYGCGVGRVTMQLAKHLGNVNAYDISAHHLALAKGRADDLHLSNIKFHECSSRPLAGLKNCDLFYSCIVFQHNPPPIIKELVKIALSSLNPGGIAIFQVPTYAVGYHFKTDAWLAANHHLSMHMHCFPQYKVFEIAKGLGCDILEVREDTWTGELNKYISNTFVIRKPK